MEVLNHSYMKNKTIKQNHCPGAVRAFLLSRPNQKNKIECGLCNEHFNEINMFHESGLYFNSSCYGYLTYYRTDHERVDLWDAIKAVKILGGKYLG